MRQKDWMDMERNFKGDAAAVRNSKKPTHKSGPWPDMKNAKQIRQKDWMELAGETTKEKPMNAPKLKRKKRFMEDEELPTRKGVRPQRVPPEEAGDYSDTGVMEHDREKREFNDFEKRYPGLRKMLKKHSKSAK